MATLVLTVGATVSTKTFNDGKGAKIIADYVAQNEDPVNGTNQEKLDWFLDSILATALESHRSRVITVEKANAVASANAKFETWT